MNITFILRNPSFFLYVLSWVKRQCCTSGDTFSLNFSCKHPNYCLWVSTVTFCNILQLLESSVVQMESQLGWQALKDIAMLSSLDAVCSDVLLLCVFSFLCITFASFGFPVEV